MAARHDDLVHWQQQQLNTRATDDLIALWQQRHTGVLVAEGLEATRRILLDRLGYLPPEAAAATTSQRGPHRKVAATRAQPDRALLAATLRWLPISAGARIFAWVYLLAGLTGALGQLLRALNGEGGVTLLAAGLTALQAAFFFLVLQVLIEGVRTARRT